MQKLHYWLTAALILALVPACHATRLELKFPYYVFTFIIGWILQSTLWAGFLYQFGVPGAFGPLRENKTKFAITFVATAMLVLGAATQSIIWLIAAFAIVIVEFGRRRGNWSRAASTLIPFAYLGLAIQVDLIFNSVIVSVRHFNLYDPFFLRFDADIFHISVLHLSHFMHFLWLPSEMVYYSMGGVMGAALLFLCLANEMRTALKMAGAIVLCFYISLLIFLAFPANGPYSLDPTAFSSQNMTTTLEKTFYFSAAALYHHKTWTSPVVAFFVSFPSLHVAQPLIAGWFLRRWKRVSILIFGYCVLLVPAILILEWHYLVDIVAGIALAAVAVALVSMDGRRLPQEEASSVLIEESSCL